MFDHPLREEGVEGGGTGFFISTLDHVKAVLVYQLQEAEASPRRHAVHLLRLAQLRRAGGAARGGLRRHAVGRVVGGCLRGLP